MRCFPSSWELSVSCIHWGELSDLSVAIIALPGRVLLMSLLSVQSPARALLLLPFLVLALTRNYGGSSHCGTLDEGQSFQ